MFEPELIAEQSVSTPAVLGAVALLGIATVTDIRSRRVPNKLVLAGLVFAVAILIHWHSESVVQMVTAATITAAALLLIRWAGIVISGRIGLGMGDIKLAFVLGLLTGIHVVGILYLAACLASVTGLAGMSIGRMKFTSSFPFVPFMAAGAVLYSFFVSI